MRYMRWDIEQLKRCKLRHYRALLRVLSEQADSMSLDT